MKRTILILVLATMILGFSACSKNCVCKTLQVGDNTGDKTIIESKIYQRKHWQTCNSVAIELNGNKAGTDLLGIIIGLAHGHYAPNLGYHIEYECTDE